MIIFGIICILLVSVIFAFWILLRSRNMQYWIFSYIRRKRVQKSSTTNVYVCLADHYEPFFGNATPQVARNLVDQWVEKYCDIAKNFSDSTGRHPQHSYFYPIEEYDEYILDRLKYICSLGFGDVDVHLHHDNDTAENLEKTLNEFKHLLFEKHQLLRKNSIGEIVYGFIHGNWALDNSRPDGRWCGVNNEIEVLLNTGCVFDMTMPSAPSDTQTSTINSIYWAKESGRCKSHDSGEALTLENWNDQDLLMIQGPLALNWQSRKFGIIPRIESSELSGDAPPTAERLELWEGAHVSIAGAEEHLFIKLHTHGLQVENSAMLFEQGGFITLWRMLEQKYKNKPGYSLHYVTAWEMYQKIKSLASSNSCEESEAKV